MVEKEGSDLEYTESVNVTAKADRMQSWQGWWWGR